MGHWIENGIAAREGITYPIRALDIPRLRRAIRRRMHELPYNMSPYPDFAGSREAISFHAVMADIDAELLTLHHKMQSEAFNEYPSQARPQARGEVALEDSPA